jgi:hypothetical protein
VFLNNFIRRATAERSGAILSRCPERKGEMFPFAGRKISPQTQRKDVSRETSSLSIRRKTRQLRRKAAVLAAKASAGAGEGRRGSACATIMRAIRYL